MQFTVLISEKPSNCYECYFYREMVVPSNEENQIDLINGCCLTRQIDCNESVCPLVDTVVVEVE